MAALLLILLLSFAALCAGGSPTQRRAALCIAAGATPIPWMAPPESPLLRGVLAVVAMWGFARVIDLVLDSRHWSVERRLWHVFGLLDTRQTKKEEPRFDRAALGKVLAYGLLTALGLVFVRSFAPRVSGVTYWAMRWIGGALFFYSLADTVEGLVGGSYRALGIIAPRQHRAPIASRSIQEFWGERWNRAVGSWLHAHCFLPLARRGYLRTGLTVAFLTSAVFHAYFTWAAVGGVMAVSMLAFFLLQGQLVLFELVLRVSQWTPMLARAWTIIAILGPSPLFVEPILRIIHCPPHG